MGTGRRTTCPSVRRATRWHTGLGACGERCGGGWEVRRHRDTALRRSRGRRGLGRVRWCARGVVNTGAGREWTRCWDGRRAVEVGSGWSIATAIAWRAHECTLAGALHHMCTQATCSSTVAEEQSAHVKAHNTGSVRDVGAVVNGQRRRGHTLGNTHLSRVPCTVATSAGQSCSCTNICNAARARAADTLCAGSAWGT